MLLIAACSTGEEEAPVCGTFRWWACSDPKTPEEWRRDKIDAQRIRLSALRHLDIDFEKCAVVVLTAELARQRLKTSDRVFVSIIGEDPTPRVLAMLAAAGTPAEPVSLQPEEKNQTGVMVMSSSDWHFGFTSIYPRWFGRYRAIAGYRCGMLCSGATEYRLKRDGDSCAIQSENELFVS